jgi:alkylation response protein AidB-like acyl-CoA dehydrogenase
MALVLNEEQRMLKDSATEFLKEHAPVDALRKLRDEKDDVGFSHDLWQQMVELGWTAIAIPEAFGGLEFGFQGLGVIFQETGHTLTASPLFSSLVLGASTIELIASEQQKEAMLPAIAAGEVTYALALEESHRHQPKNIACAATTDGDNYRLNGKKVFVLDGHTADKLLVVARTSGATADETGISVFLVDKNAQGLKISRTIMMDSRNAANIEFDNVSAELLGEADQALAGLNKVLDRGRAILAAEMLGGCLEMFQRTMEYLKDREQFGVKIGSFQALKHRASIMFVEIELAKSVVLDALTAIDNNADNADQLASIAKAKLNDTYQ